MKTIHPTGLGEPEPAGKLALFQPPKETAEPTQEIPRRARKENSKKDAIKKPSTAQRRIRTTINLTGEALKVIQGIQQEHRLRIGKVLPLWKAVSQAIEYYGHSKGSNSA
jgi:hypothetical protein